MATSAKDQAVVYNLKIIPLIIEGKEQLSHQDYLQVLGVLPDFILKINGILATDLTEGDLGEILESHRDAFKAIRWWLYCAYAVENSHIPDIPQSPQTWEMDYKPHAEESLAFLHLCEEILKRDQFGWKDSLPDLTALDIWFSCAYERLEGSLRRNGILARAERSGKQAVCDAMSKRIRNDFATLPSKKFAHISEVGKIPIEKVNCTEQAVLSHADYIAKQDYEFCHQHYQKYINAEKRASRSIRNNPNFKTTILDSNGCLCVGGKGKRGQGKKGFSEQM